MPLRTQPFFFLELNERERVSGVLVVLVIFSDNNGGGKGARELK
jgi:hypothetical protein